MSITEFTVKEVTVFIEPPLFWTKYSAKYNLLGIYKIFNIFDFNKEWSFDYSNFDIDNYYFLVHMKLF